VFYFVRGRKDFTGPPVPTDVAPGEEVPVTGLAIQESRQDRTGDIEGKGEKLVNTASPTSEASKY
jgi:hypothetical protein